jgi:hypothetical protein
VTQPTNEDIEDMAKGAELPKARRAARPRAEVLSELPMVTALLVAAVIVALMAAGGPVLDMLHSLNGVGR